MNTVVNKILVVCCFRKIINNRMVRWSLTQSGVTVTSS